MTDDYYADDKLIAVTCELANRILEMKFGKEYKNKCLVKVGTCTHYTELGQTTFDNIYDQVENLIMENVEEYAPYKEERRINK